MVEEYKYILPVKVYQLCLVVSEETSKILINVSANQMQGRQYFSDQTKIETW